MSERELKAAVGLVFAGVGTLVLQDVARKKAASLGVEPWIAVLLFAAAGEAVRRLA